MLGSHSFEVVVEAAGKTEIIGMFESKEAAISRAESLLAQKKHTLVEVYKVKSDDKRLRIFREAGTVPNQNITIAAIDGSAICNDDNQVFCCDSRITLLRLLRAWFNQRIMIPLELLHNYTALREIEASPLLFDQGLNRLAGLQAHQTGEPTEQRHKVLSGLVRSVMGLARSAEDLQPYADLLVRRGLSELIAELEASYPPEKHARVITYAVARRFAGFDARDWTVLITAGCDLFADNQSDAAAAWVDEILAETVDCNDAVKALLGHVPELRLGLEALMAAAEGTWRKGLPGQPALQRLAKLTAARPLPRVRTALIGRVAQALDGAAPLTKGDRAQEGLALRHLARRLTNPTGCIGGPAMAAALTRRARSAFAEGDEQIAFDHAAGAIADELGVLPARLCFILELLKSDAGRKHAEALSRRLDGIIGGLRSVRDLGAAWTDETVRSRIRQGLIQSNLERQQIDCMLDRLDRLPESAAQASEALCLKVSHRGAIHLVEAGGPPLTMGRGEGCRLTLVSLAASRNHAEIRHEDGAFFLVDSSTNGTVLKGPDGGANVICRARAALPGCGSIVIAIPRDATSQGGEAELIEFGPADSGDKAEVSCRAGLMAEIAQAVRLHGAWRQRLRDMIEGDPGQAMVSEMGDEHACGFGLWLDGSSILAEALALPVVAEIKVMHRDFHACAAGILALAQEGRKDEALQFMETGSSYDSITKRLIQALKRWHDNV